MRYDDKNPVEGRTVGIMQPYFFPYIGYYQLLNFVDIWVIFDDVQYIHRGWVNRNRILNPQANNAWQYITVPLSGRKKHSKINEVIIDNTIAWKEELFGKLTVYKKKAPHYQSTVDLVADCINTCDASLSDMLVNSLKIVSNYLSIDTPIIIQSEANLSNYEIVHPGQWALEISKSLNATTYVNPIHGEGLFNRDDFYDAGIELKFIKPNLRQYSQRIGSFIPDLSIIDVMMWNDNKQLTQMICNDFEIC